MSVNRDRREASLPSMPGGCTRTRPRQCPFRRGFLMADSQKQQELVSKYLALVEQLGAEHPTVKQFVSTHKGNLEIAQWADVVNELHAKGTVAPGVRSVTRVAWAV